VSIAQTVHSLVGVGSVIWQIIEKEINAKTPCADVILKEKSEVPNNAL